MGEFQEFAEALFGQLAVEIDEEKEIIGLATKARDNIAGKVEFKKLEDIANEIIPDFKGKVEEFLGTKVPKNIELKFPELEELKRIKGKKVFSDEKSNEFVTELFNAVAKENYKKIAELMQQDTKKYFVYSTYAIQYISKITTTYGDYLDGEIYLNKFILSRYPEIILHKKGEPYESNFENVNSGYQGAVKMTVLEEVIHSAQENLQQVNMNAAREVNKINEELAGIILSLDTKIVNELSEYCQLQAVTDDSHMQKKQICFSF